MVESSESPRHEDELRPAADAPLARRLERLRALRSAFGALAPSAVSETGQAIAAAGRALTQRLSQTRHERDSLAPADQGGIDAALDAFESSMRALARSVSVPQLRSTLPGRLSSDRRSVLDLLDLLLGAGLRSDPDWGNRIGTLDYLITLLCTHGARCSGGVTHDPIALTPRLSEICERAEEIVDARLDDAQAKFFAAAGMDRESLHEEFQQRTWRQRKVDLGGLFFAPRILRAIITYNAALLSRVTDEILDAGDWGVVAPESRNGEEIETPGGSLFASKRLRRIAAAAGQRARGEDAPDSAEIRIVAALEFDDLDASEREALGRETVGTLEDPIGTAILIGLLCRSLAVLSIDLQDFGICPDDVSDVWLHELDQIFQREIDDKHAHDAYKQACALAELKNKFLLAPLADRLREERSLTQAPTRTANTSGSGPASLTMASPTPASATPPRSERTDRAIKRAKSAKPGNHERARDLVREALDVDRRGRDKVAATHSDRGGWSSARMGQTALAAFAIAAAAVFYRGRPEPDLKAFSHAQLELVSTFLVAGHRNGDGRGPGFVGTLDESWKSLPHEGRQAEAEALVHRLREHGLQQVMIYDRNQSLRIQAIGSQPVRAL